MLKTDFTDSGYWDELAKRHLSSYNLPNWHEVCSRIEMEKWMNRLDLMDYEKIVNTTLEEFRELNKDWPLRAFIGLLLEQREEQSGNRHLSGQGG